MCVCEREKSDKRVECVSEMDRSKVERIALWTLKLEAADAITIQDMQPKYFMNLWSNHYMTFKIVVFELNSV